MQTQKAKIDWLTATWYPDPDEHVPATVHSFLNSIVGGVFGVDCAGMFGYAHGVRFYAKVDGQEHHLARVDYGGTHHKMRARLDLSGSCCSLVKDWLLVDQWISSQPQYKLTRVDLAVDFLDGEYTVDDAVDWYKSGLFHAGGRKPRHSTPGDWLDPHHGRTLEIGRRVNGKMLRAYEKGRQLGDPESKWTRFEVEIRNIDRDIPIEVLTDPDTYFTGAYKALEHMLDAAATRIETHQAEGEISLDHMLTYQRQSYGRLVTVLRATMTPEQIIESISRPGVPQRLEKSALVLSHYQPLLAPRSSHASTHHRF